MKPWSNNPKPHAGSEVNPSTISAINRLPDNEKHAIYAKIIPTKLLEKFKIPSNLVDNNGHDLFFLSCPSDSTSTEISLYHEHEYPDPVLYGHITDTINAQIHILFYVLNNPEAQRFDIDRLPDGTETHLGVKFRNIEAEVMAMEAGLSPGQIRQGPHLLREALITFENFILSLNHDLHFAEPLFYHNAIIFEKYGFSYQKGHRLMKRIQAGFGPGGDLRNLLDGSTPFRQPQAANSIRLRSWAIHDGIMGEPFRNVTMYKQVGKKSGLSTSLDCSW